MFMDGLIYSVVANNLANGLGTFWDPHFTDIHLTHFHEHPPFAFGLQSLFYTLFGDNRYIDKAYSLLTYLITAYLIVKIWKQLKLKKGWIALLLWLFIPVVFWASTNNMLENTLNIFVLLSTLFILKHQDGKGILFLILSGLMLSMGFLTKGFVAFFVWTFPFVSWLVKRKQSFNKMLLETGIIVSVTLVFLSLLFLLPAARESIFTYLDVQVMNSLKNVRTVDSRFFILERLFFELLIPIGICLLVVILFKGKRHSMKLMQTNLQLFLIFFITGLTGVLPVMISAKQSGFYILSTYPFFAIALGALIEPLINRLCDNIKCSQRGIFVLKFTGYVVFLAGIFCCLYFSTTVGRDENKIKDTYQILEIVPKGSIITILPTMYQDWTLHGYYARYGTVSLDPYNKRTYLLAERYCPIEASLLNEYQEINVQTADYRLFKKMD